MDAISMTDLTNAVVEMPLADSMVKAQRLTIKEFSVLGEKWARAHIIAETNSMASSIDDVDERAEFRHRALIELATGNALQRGVGAWLATDDSTRPIIIAAIQKANTALPVPEKDIDALLSQAPQKQKIDFVRWAISADELEKRGEEALAEQKVKKAQAAGKAPAALA